MVFTEKVLLEDKNMELIKLIDIDFNGAVLVKKDGVKILAQAYGYSNIPDEISNHLHTKFATASAGKTFVAVGILQLIQKKKLDLNATIGELLYVDWHSIDPNITVRQLLTHTSGIPDYFDESVMDDYAELWRNFPNYRIRKNRDLLPLFIGKPMMYPAGKRFQYNNTGFVVLALILEEIGKVPFDVYLKDKVFDPAGMENTGYYELDRLPKNCAYNYIWDKERNEYYTNIYSVDAKGTGAGGAFTTVLDIEKFWESLLNGRLLSKALVDEMLKVQAYDNENSYGYGMWLTDDGEPFFQGSDPGVSFFSCYDRQKKILMTFVSNTGNDVWKLAKNVREVLAGK